MKTRRTLLQILLAALVMLSLCGCGKKEKPAEPNTPDPNAVQQAIQEAEPNAAVPM